MLADDHPSIIGGLITALEAYGYEVVGSVADPESVWSEYERLRPDVLILDVQFNSLDTGLQIARSLLEKHQKAKIIFYSQYSQPELIRAAYRLGGSGFVTKNARISSLVEAIAHVASKGIYMGPAVAEIMAKLAIEGDEAPQSLLNERELKVFAHMASGLTNAEIAGQMELSTKTISNISQAVKDKLRIHRQADLTRLAIKHHIIRA